MNVLDENVPASQCAILRSKRVAFKQIGREIGWSGMDDEDVIPLLHQLDRPTLFTLDVDFYDRRLCHAGYCLVHLDVAQKTAADYVHRLLRHREFRTKAKRMGAVIRISVSGITLWRMHQVGEHRFTWAS